MPAVFSPTQTKDYAFCPRYWDLRHRQGVRPQVVEYPEIAGVLGSAFSRSMEVWNTYRIEGLEPDPDVAYQAGQAAIEEELARFRAQGRRVAGKGLEEVGKLPLYLQRAVQLVAANDPLAGYEIVAAEPSYPDHGWARPDVLYLDTGRLVVADYKVKIELQERWKEKEFRKYDDDWKQYHYAWITGTTRYQIIFVVLKPKAYIEIKPYAVTAEYMPVWLQDAERLWHEMASAKMSSQIARGTTVHSTPYGPCEYQEACLQYGLDPERMKIEYVQIERRKP